MGTEEFWVPAVVAALGAGAGAVNQRNASNRQDQAQAQAIRDQMNTQSQGVAAANRTTNQIARSNPNDIANKATGDYIAQLRENAAGSTQGGSTTGGAQTFGRSTSALGATPGGSARFQSDTANAQKEVQSYGNNYANEMGQLDAAIRQRQNEGLSMEDLQTKLNTLNSQSWGQNFVDQLRAATAGQPNPWINLGANMLQRGANAYATNATPSAGPSAIRVSGNNPTNAGNGLTQNPWTNV